MKMFVAILRFERDPAQLDEFIINGFTGEGTLLFERPSYIDENYACWLIGLKIICLRDRRTNVVAIKDRFRMLPTE